MSDELYLNYSNNLYSAMPKGKTASSTNPFVENEDFEPVQQEKVQGEEILTQDAAEVQSALECQNDYEDYTYYEETEDDGTILADDAIKYFATPGAIEDYSGEELLSVYFGVDYQDGV